MNNGFASTISGGKNNFKTKEIEVYQITGIWRKLDNVSKKVYLFTIVCFIFP